MKYELRTSVWRCGSSGKEGVNALRTTEFCLLENEQGGMCCLGQFARQVLGPEVKIRVGDGGSGAGTPEGLAGHLGTAYDSLFVRLGAEPYAGAFENTDLSRNLMILNDDSRTTLQEKIDSIRSLLGEEGHELVVIDDLGLGLH